MNNGGPEGESQLPRKESFVVDTAQEIKDLPHNILNFPVNGFMIDEQNIQFPCTHLTQCLRIQLSKFMGRRGAYHVPYYTQRIRYEFKSSASLVGRT